METLEDILIAQGQVEKIFGRSHRIDLWRAIRLDDDRPNPLHPDLAPRTTSPGVIRPPDLHRYQDPGTRQWLVKAELGKGTSTASRHGIFGARNWSYVLIPAQTRVPSELIITKDFWWEKKNAWHYSISPQRDMLESVFLKALDQLAINARIQLRTRKNA